MLSHISFTPYILITLLETKKKYFLVTSIVLPLDEATETFLEDNMLDPIDTPQSNFFLIHINVKTRPCNIIIVDCQNLLNNRSSRQFKDLHRYQTNKISMKFLRFVSNSAGYLNSPGLSQRCHESMINKSLFVIRWSAVHQFYSDLPRN